MKKLRLCAFALLAALGISASYADHHDKYSLGIDFNVTLTNPGSEDSSVSVKVEKPYTLFQLGDTGSLSSSLALASTFQIGDPKKTETRLDIELALLIQPPKVGSIQPPSIVIPFRRIGSLEPTEVVKDFLSYYEVRYSYLLDRDIRLDLGVGYNFRTQEYSTMLSATFFFGSSTGGIPDQGGQLFYPLDRVDVRIEGPIKAVPETGSLSQSMMYAGFAIALLGFLSKFGCKRTAGRSC